MNLNLLHSRNHTHTHQWKKPFAALPATARKESDTQHQMTEVRPGVNEGDQSQRMHYFNKVLTGIEVQVCASSTS